MNGKVAKALRRRAREVQSENAPNAEYYPGPHGEAVLKKGTTRMIVKLQKKRRKAIIADGGAPWQKHN